MWLQADAEVEDDFVETCSLDLLERVCDMRRRSEQHRILGEVLGPHLAQPLDHPGEVSIAGGSGIGITRQRRNRAFSVIADLAFARDVLLLLVVGEMYEVGAHQAARRPPLLRARLLVYICYLPQPAVSNGSREGRNREVASEPRGKLDRGV